MIDIILFCKKTFGATLKMFHYELKKHAVALVICILFYAASPGAAITCKGRPSAVQSYTPMCTTTSSAANFEQSQSCAAPAVEAFSKTCSASHCTQTNIKIASGVFGDTDNKIWSVGGCFTQIMPFKICSGEIQTTTAATESTVTTTSSTNAPTTTSTAGPTESTTSQSTTTMMTTTTTELTESTTTMSTESTTTQSTSTTTAGMTTTTNMESTTTGDSPNLPAFTGCISGELRWSSATCAADASITVNGAYVNATTGAESPIDSYVQVIGRTIGCCNSDNCTAKDTVSRPNSCYYGNSDTTTTVECSSDCFSVVTSSGLRRGCFADVDLASTGFADVTTCGDTQKSGICLSNNDCVRCCTTDNCNVWTSKSAILGETDDDDDDDSHSVKNSISVLLLIFTYLFVQLF